MIIRVIRSKQTLLILLAFAAAAGAGLSGLLIPSAYAPLVVGTVFAGAAMFSLWITRPAWALYTALIVIFLPAGIIPAAWHSNLNRGLTVAALVFWIISTALHRRKIYWSAAHWFFLGFLIWSLASLFWALDTASGLRLLQSYSLRFILFFLVLLNQTRTRADLDRLMRTLAVIGWVMILTSIITILVSGYQPGTRLRVAEQNENELGIIALMALPGVLWKTAASSNSRKIAHALLSLAYLSLSMVVIALSGSRGSAISLLVTILALLLFRQTRSWAAVFLLVLVLAAVLTPFIFSTTMDRFLDTSGGSALGGRERIWQAAVDLAAERPWSGVGIGNSSSAVLSHLRMYQNVANQSKASLHNPLLVILAETGVPGLLLYLGVLAGCVWSALRVYFRPPGRAAPALQRYFALILAVFLGYMASWIKGGGMESDHSYFFMLALLLIPSILELETFHEEQG